MSEVIHVSNSEELVEALDNATGGETLLLEGGDYGALKLNEYTGVDLSFPDTVTIASADPSDPAVFSSVYIRGATNLTFDGILFDYTFQEGD
ncbi:right-handed parallel beta-helix repeat-containing protein, partial [Actibacterium sp. D379-3]